MSRFAVIGLGNFGSNVARVLYELGHEVICVDRNEDLIKTAHDFSTFGLVGPATDMNLLSSLQIKTLDAVFVSLGDEMADSILVTLHLRDLGAKRIIAKITSEDHGRVLLRVGAHEVVFPERDMAVQVANHVSSPTIMNYLDLSPEYMLAEIIPINEFVGQTLAQTQLRRDYGVNVIGVKDIMTERITANPPADFVIKDSEILIVIGRRDDLARLTRKQEKR